MKTSTKLLFGFLTLVILIILSTIIVVRIYYEGTKKGHNLPDFKNVHTVTTTEKTIPDINKLNVNFSCRLYYKQSSNSKLLIKTNSKSSFKKTKFNVNNGQLDISYEGSHSFGDIIEIWVNSDSLNYIKLKNGVYFETDSFNVSDCILDIYSSIVHAEMNVSNLKIKGDAKSIIKAEGKVNFLNLNSKNNSIMELTGLKAENVTVKASGNSNIVVDATNYMTVDIKGKSKLKYSGDPQINIINSEQNAKIEKIVP